jgi:lipoate-protein ligase B
VRKISVVNLGRTDYKSCWELQQSLLEKRVANQIDDVLLLTEHEHVYTIGKSGDENHLLANSEELSEQRIGLYHNDRGGDITYHGPGQLVGYPILDLNNYYLDLHRYLRDIEEVVIQTLARFGVTATRDENYTGVWVGNNKICAIGIKTSRWVTMHGFALNISTDLSFFDRIIPCGIFEKGVTSLEQEVIGSVSAHDVAVELVKEFGCVFGATMETRTVAQLGMHQIAAVELC